MSAGWVRSESSRTRAWHGGAASTRPGRDQYDSSTNFSLPRLNSSTINGRQLWVYPIIKTARFSADLVAATSERW